MKLLLIDNYDSFTYLLAQYFEELDCSVTVVNDQDKRVRKLEFLRILFVKIMMRLSFLQVQKHQKKPFLVGM